MKQSEERLYDHRVPGQKFGMPNECNALPGSDKNICFLYSSSSAFDSVSVDRSRRQRG